MILKKELLRNINNEPISPITSSQTVYREDENKTVESSLNILENQILNLESTIGNLATILGNGRRGIVV